MAAQNKKMISSVKDFSAKAKKLQDLVDRNEKFISELKSKNALLSSENKALKMDLSEKELIVRNLSDTLAKYTANPEETKGDEVEETDKSTAVEATEENWGEGSLFGETAGRSPEGAGRSRTDDDRRGRIRGERRGSAGTGFRWKLRDPGR